VIGGELYGCGYNDEGEYDLGDGNPVPTFTKIDEQFDGSGIRSIKCVSNLSLVLTNAGNVFSNDGMSKENLNFVQIDYLYNIKMIDIYDFFLIALSDEGLYCCERQLYGWNMPENISIVGTIILKISCGPYYVMILTNKGLWTLELVKYRECDIVNHLNGKRDKSNPGLKKIDLEFDFLSIIDMKCNKKYILLLTANGFIYKTDGHTFIKIEITFINPKIFIGSMYFYILHDITSNNKCITQYYKGIWIDTKLDFDVQNVVIEDNYDTIFYIGEDSVYCVGNNDNYNLGLGHRDEVLEPILHPFLSGKNLLGFPNRNNVKRAN